MANTRNKDYYSVLGVTTSASDKQIHHAYRSLARKHHPDLHPGSKGKADRFKEINQAYTVLKDPEKRKEYDAKRGNVAPQRRRADPSSRPYTRQPPPGSGIHVSVSRNKRPGDRPGAGANLDITISGLSAGLGIVSGLLGGLDRFLSAAERAASGQRTPPRSGPDADKRR